VSNCDYCGKKADYMFGDGSRTCSACNSRLPLDLHTARLRIVELERTLIRAEPFTLCSGNVNAIVRSVLSAEQKAKGQDHG
jgi:hypothetical protein